MSWLWRIIGALMAFIFASLSAYIDRSLGDAVAQIWRLLGAGLVIIAALAGLMLLVSAPVVLADSKIASRG
jgi:hypothetical protein